MASEIGRGAQVRLDGDGRQLARGGTGLRLIDNIREKLEEEAGGNVADGSTPDGSTRNGAAARDEALITGGAALPDALDTANAAAVTATAAASASAGSAATATTKAGDAASYAGDAASALAATAAARDAAAVSAASANALNPAVSADAGRTDVSLLVADPAGNTALELSADGSTLKLAGITITSLGDGTLRLTRRDASGSFDIAPNGSVTTGGITLVPSASTDYAWAVSDDNGYAPLQVLGNGTVVANNLTISTDGAGGVLLKGPDGSTVLQCAAGGAVTVPGPLTNGGTTALAVSRTDISWAVADANGFIALAVKADGTLLGSGLTGSSDAVATTFSADEAAERNARALAISADTPNRYQAAVQRPVFGVNHFLSYGQSLSIGQEGHPRLTKSQPYDNLMLGSSVHPTSLSGTTWTPIGTAQFNPLIATVRDTSDPGGLIDDTASAALAWNASNIGETPLEGALSYLRRAWLDTYGLTADPSRLFLASACGVGGRLIEQLSKGASPEQFNRLRTCATAAKSVATGLGKSYGVPAVVFLQGEQNYNPANGGDSTKAGYKAELKQLVADIRADVQTTIAGQSRPFAFVTYQTGATYTTGAEMAIGQAQWECSEEEENWHLAAPAYPVTDKFGHLDANGYRWLGNQIGKVLHRALILGQKWRPVCPLQATMRGREILVDFHVPRPPLVFDLPWVMNTATDYTSKGFAVYDSGGNALTIASIALAGDALVKITLVTDVPTGATVRYATSSTSGGGCLRDSDPTTAFDTYDYTAGSGQTTAENIIALVGKPYPLWNWCVAFNIPAVAA